MQIALVPAQYMDFCWPKIEKYLDGAAKYTYGRFSVTDIKSCITDYDHHLWVAYDGEDFYGAVVTQFLHYPGKKMLAMHFAGGIKLVDWKDPMLLTLQKIARDSGCSGIEVTGRAGWLKIFKNDGIKQNFVTFELPVAETEE
jgi:hypothetical protein